MKKIMTVLMIIVFIMGSVCAFSEGNADADNAIEEGIGYWFGSGPNGYDMQKAQEAFKKAADLGDVDAWYWLGVLEECEVEKDHYKIEEGIEGHKSHTGGNTSKPGMTDESLDGELLVEFLANSMRESFRTKLRSMKATLGVPVGDREHDLRNNLEAEAKVKNWIRKNLSYT